MVCKKFEWEKSTFTHRPFGAYVIYQTRETVFHRHIQSRRRKLKKRRAAEFFNESRGVWIANETPSRVFDISSQSKQNLRSKRKSEIVKIYAN